MKTSLPYSKLFFSVTLFFSSLLTIKLSAQSNPALEFTSGAGNPILSGPSITNQVITFQNNTNNPSGNSFSSYSPTRTVAFALSNQQYTLPITQIITARGLSFGANINNSGSLAPASALFPQMNSIGSPSNTNFTSSTAVPSGTGIDISINRAVSVFTSARALYNAGASTSGRHYFGDLTITFNQPVVNPVIHLVGLGGYYRNLGFSSELELQTLGVTLSKRSGSGELNVTSGKNILNSSSNPSSTTGSGAASGSVTAIGAGFTTLSFRIYMRGDGDESSWGTSSLHQGDLWLIGTSVTTSMTNVILPVELSSFSVIPKDKKSLINWVTASESNVSHFIVEKGSDGINFKDAGMVFAFGNSNEIKNYSFTDNAGIESGMIYYRLRIVDIDGKTNYSEIRTVRMGQQAERGISISTYPNPVSNELKITIPENWQGKKTTYEVITNNGQVVAKKETNNSSQTEAVNISTLSPGFYLTRVSCGKETAIQKIIKN